MITNNKFVNDILNDLKETSKYLSEAYIFGEHGEEMPMSPEAEQYEMQKKQMNGEGGDESVEEKAMHAQEVIRHEPIIAKIRETAIEGLKKYADNPTSELYAYFKSVLIDSDKVLTDATNKK